MLNLTRLFVVALMAAVLASPARAEDPLRVFIRAGVKTHGPDQHDHPRFLTEWTKLLNERGAKCDGAMDFPTEAQLDNTDVLVMYAADAGMIPADQRVYLDKFLKRGGGIVCIHDAVCGKEADWFKTIIGGAWQHGKAKWYEGEVGLYFQDTSHPITKGITNFDLKDEIYYSLNFEPDVKILASSFHDVFTIAPQMWVYEKDNHRAFVSIPGHNYSTFNLPHYRAMLLRGIAWAGKRTNVDMLCSKEELASMHWPEGGPLPPEKEKELVVVHPDFNMTLVAADPLINKAINMDWDARGRLWVCETPEYPAGRKPPKTAYLERGMNAEVVTEDRPARDRISILEDTNGDGIMDKKTVFADGLELVTSMVFYKDGVICSQAPDIYWLRDTDGDGKADQKITLYTGLGTGDTHSVMNNLRWGLDGWIYATHGYSAGTVKSPDNTKNFGTIGSGVVRFRPDGSMIEQYSSKGGNTWGLDVAWDGEIFYTQPTSNDLLMHVVVPESILARGKVDKTPSYKVLINNRSSFPLMSWNRQAYVQIDLVGKFTASAGCAIYDGGAWPKEWNNSYFTTEPQINIVHHEMVTLNGVSYDSNKVREPEFMAGKHLWFRPIETRIGPDGALYVIDWYNQAITHNDTRGPKHTFRNAAVRPDRDHYYGRIWRVQHKDAIKIEVPNLEKASAADLVKALDGPNLHTRLTARRLLSERGMDAVADLQKLVANEAANPKARVPALSALADLGKATPDVIKSALKSENPGVRKNGVIAAARTGTDVGEALTPLLSDADPRVRIETIIAMSSLPMTKLAAQKMVDGYSDLKDPWSQSAVVAASKSNPLAFCEAVLNGANAPGPLANLLGSFTTQLAGSSKAEDVAALLNLIAAAPAAKDDLKISVLTTLSRESKAALPWSPELEKSLKALLGSENAQIANAAMPLVARWDTKGALAGEIKGRISKMMESLNDAKLPDAQRGDIARGLLSLSATNADVLPAVSKVLAETDSMGLKKEIVAALSAVPSAEAGKELIAAFPSLPGDIQMTAFNELLKRTDWSMALLDALDSNKIKATLLGPANLHRLRQHADAAVAKRANEAIDKILGPETKEKDALIAKFTPIVSAPGGDAVKGKEVFLKNCSTCHKIGDVGREVGPVLTGIGAHGPAALIVAILDPNREVEPSFTSWMVKTKDGEVFDGILVRENAGGILLRNAAGEREVKKDDIKMRRNTGMSLMPNGFESLGGDQLKDLLAFVCGADQKYRFVDLSAAYTADTRKGLYASDTNADDSFKFKKMGVVTIENIPFNFQDPAKIANGKNVVVLAGGATGSFSKTKMPKKVEAKLGVAAKTLHILGGVGGWGYPAVKEKDPVMKLTVVYANGETEEYIYKNGVEFGDYLGEPEVPGSKAERANMANHAHVRYFAQPLKKQAVVDKIILESYDNGVAPTTVAITAEMIEAAK